MEILIKIVLPLGLAFIMFSLGLGLTVTDFTRVVQRPFAFITGAVHQIILLPVVVFLTINAFGISGELAVGFMILAVCPGGVTSNVISRLANADVALSVSLTAIISLVSAVTVPILIGLSFQYFMGSSAVSVNVLGIAFAMFALTVIPIGFGLMIRAANPQLTQRMEPMISHVATVLFAIIVIAAVAANWSLFMENLASIGLALVAINIVLLAIGFGIPRLLGMSLKEAKTLSIETGIQNSTLGIAIASLLVAGAPGFSVYSLPVAVYGILMYVVTLPVVAWYRKLH